MVAGQEVALINVIVVRTIFITLMVSTVAKVIKDTSNIVSIFIFLRPRARAVGEFLVLAGGLVIGASLHF
ncbi:hypothetical protein AUEXF2481DRAFT_185433 [Aureobasidium subglaciale EXF-2481]|uniref:Uncharacterized protein n=1 Tax=Aureobasidium subglaciale (strain EXF-2481) TaxID=1043005 RepID=A0A074ZMM3_AURSE|nr:uncharacterized protein AUEXF2481DRAFT_185433 [Aureobasidium subglaciale EXF-2481]KEQ99596.1 hypothetical protein AUEXF2481DRAFT_185433 [Aureobasidium subglaciale EXF-2481]